MNGTKTRQPGRPRAFDRERALEAAMLLFWRHGYEGVSLSQLTRTMGINAPSLYAAFRSKEELYREALRLYLDGLGNLGIRSLVDAPDAKEGMRKVLLEAAAAFTRPDLPPGCMVGIGSLRCAEGNRIAAAETAALRKRSQAAFEARLRRARREGELAPGVDIVALTDFYSSVIEGMSVQAQDGASRARLIRLVDVAMAAWPTC